VAAAFLGAEKNFRRILGYRDLQEDAETRLCSFFAFPNPAIKLAVFL